MHQHGDFGERRASTEGLIRLAVTGIVAPIWFIVLVTVSGLLQPDYSHVAMPISVLAAGRAGWLQNLNFFISGALLGGFTIGLHYAIRPTRLGLLGIFLLLGACLGLWIIALFPWMNVDGVLIEPPGHVIGAVITFLSAGVGHAILSGRMRADPHWRELSTYVLGTGLVMLLLFVVLGGFALEQGTPLHPWAGLLQRVLVAVWFACILVMARRILRLARTGIWGTHLP